MGKQLIILGAGYLGTQLAKEAMAQGWEVSALTRNEATANHLKGLGLAAVVVAHLQEDNWHTALPPYVDAVVNCVSAADPSLDGYRLSYVQGQKSILKWAANGNIATYIYTSSTGIYPQGGGADVDETAPLVGLKPKGLILLGAEELVRSAVCFKRHFVLRLSGIYGPGRHYMLDQLKSGNTTFFGNPHTILNSIYRDDAVSAILAAMNAPEILMSATYNVSSGERITKKNLLDYLAQRLGVDAPRFDPPLNEDISMPNRYIVAQKIRETLSWTPRYQDIKACYRDVILKM